jgi:hypothetical protein
MGRRLHSAVAVLMKVADWSSQEVLALGQYSSAAVREERGEAAAVRLADALSLSYFNYD